MRLFFSSLIFFCFATASAQCTYGDIEITVTGDTYKRIILTNTVSGEAFQSSGTSSTYDQLPEALNSVSQWEPVSFGTEFTPNLSISWDGYSILNTLQTECMAFMLFYFCDNTSDCFEAYLLSLGGEFSVQPDGSILLLTAACDAPVGFCDCNGGVLDDCGVCGGDNSTCTDCAGVVNGDALIQAYFFDADGDGFGYGEAVEYCSGSVPTCTDGDGDGVETGCWVLNNHDFYPDCYSNIVDCNGTCDGYEVENGCGECGGDQWALWYADIDGDGLGDPNTEISSCDYIEGYIVWNNTDPDDNCFSNVIDECGVCDGAGIAEGACDCDGNVLDECGVCGGDNSTCADCCGVPNGDGTTCDGDCGPCGEGIPDGDCDCNGNQLDECGVCGGDNSTCADCCGVPNGDGTTCDGACGACNDDASCYGCTYADATNYASTATIDDGSCLYAACDVTSNDQEVYDEAYAAGVASVVCPDGGSSCPGDLDNDGAVATTDLLIFLSAYGDSCDDVVVFDCGNDITHEGYDYSTVLIGDQCWFSENCRYLPEVSPSSDGNISDPYYYVNGFEGADVIAAQATDNYSTYGVLYNWPAVMTEGICPSGWHIPTDGEFTELTDFLGGEDVAGAKMKEAGYDHWDAPNTGATNSSGWTGLPGGIRYAGAFGDPNYSGVWWSASEELDAEWPFSWGRGLYNGSDDVYRDSDPKAYAYSARCVRD
jgi:uncharacterized protein (TIGR02145 family)